MPLSRIETSHIRSPSLADARSAARIRILRGVVQKVRKHLAQPDGVAKEAVSSVSRQIRNRRYLISPHRASAGWYHRRSKNTEQFDRFAPGPRSFPGDTRDFQQVVDQADQMVHLTVHHRSDGLTHPGGWTWPAFRSCTAGLESGRADYAVRGRAWPGTRLFADPRFAQRSLDRGGTDGRETDTAAHGRPWRQHRGQSATTRSAVPCSVTLPTSARRPDGRRVGPLPSEQQDRQVRPGGLTASDQFSNRTALPFQYPLSSGKQKCELSSILEQLHHARPRSVQNSASGSDSVQEWLQKVSNASRCVRASTNTPPFIFIRHTR